MYRNPVRKGRTGSSCDWKKNVPESGTQRKNRVKLRSEEKRTGIRYAKEESGQAAIRRKTYRNPVRKERIRSSYNRKKNVPESGTLRKSLEKAMIERAWIGIQYAQEYAALKKKRKIEMGDLVEYANLEMCFY